MNVNKIILLREFTPYFFIGATVTLIDWTLFWVATHRLGFHYQFALIVSYSIAGFTHYTANKLITFRCHSKQLGSQLSLYLLITGSSLLCSMGIMALLINLFFLKQLLARILTTGLMLIPNYLLHKHITFNKRIFAQSTT